MAVKLFYFIKRFGYNTLPSAYFRQKYYQLRAFEQQCNQQELQERLTYYCKPQPEFELPAQAVAKKDFKRKKGTEYFLDLKEFLHYFSPHFRFAYHFGDETHINPYPTIFKARPVGENNQHSVLFKLDKRRHFQWATDTLNFREKNDLLVWRGVAHTAYRKEFVQKFWNEPGCDVGQIPHKKKIEQVPWQKGFLSINEQLKSKFIFCPEGHDVATSLKWIMSSNSLSLMPQPSNESWFMEGTLQPGKHYVEIKRDFSDIKEKMAYYTENPAEAEEIIRNAKAHVARFLDPQMEDLLGLKVLERYAELSGQPNALRYK
jgi:hypothetical protein